MQLTGKQIVENNIITNYCAEGVQQQGVDVRVAKVFGLKDHGYIPAQGKTQKCDVFEIKPMGGTTFALGVGYYELELMEGCSIPANAEADFKTRSGLVRCGATIHSGQYDAGFNTDRMGCFLETRIPIRIDVGARVAQFVVNETYSVDEGDLYNGQWQNDKQRTEQQA